jgi:phosphomannomutase
LHLQTYCLRHLEAEHFTTIHFFGDKTTEGGNDFELYSHPSVKGHRVEGPADTMKQLHETFKF